jgi:hypothetical protein
MVADNALPADELAPITAHVESCGQCQAQLAAARVEAQFMTRALQIELPDEMHPLSVPKFSRPLSLRGFALANIATGLVIWLAQFLWKTIFGELILNATTWVTSIYLPDIYAMTSATALYLIEEGTAMFDTYLGFIVASLSAITLLSLVLIYRKSHASMGVCMLVMLAGAMVLPEPVSALELRRDEDMVTIAKSETIDDTVLVAAETVLIEGVITGDLIAVGREIDVTGSVGGNLITFAESVTVRGEVGGLVIGGASSYDLRGASVVGDVWIGGEKIGIDEAARVGRNVTLAGESISVEGDVGKDLYAFAESVELSGTVGEDLEAFSNRLRLLGGAEVGGNVRFRNSDEDKFYRAENVKIGGAIEFSDMPEALEEENPYATAEFYLWQIAKLIGAFLVGVALLWAMPSLRTVSIGAGIDALKTAGVGFITMVVVPLVAVLVGLTLIGLPLSAIAFAAWLLGLYLAKVIVGAAVGRMVLSESDSLPLTLLAGLLIVVIAVNLPFIGGIINFVLTLIGLGLLVQHVLSRLPSRAPVAPV